ncbi:single-stranded-DNA-specific exonuclease RecJ [Dubosiella newyorkensis]|uniref:single-stranded-DNA-specific exonuclease RecJ n=2 Tax=Dubosiella newyorkensis TaxID=1862672 RepID=UPI0024B9093A|nr:DHH family phosphoesterase [Dubosiella newyorkensis]
MTKLSNLAQQVLNTLEPDLEKQEKWLEHNELYSCSESAEMLSFREVIEQAKEEGQKIFVAGDYDCDGIMATTIMVDGLRKFGCTVGFYIPDRIKEGYGLNTATIEQAYQKGYTILVTVDNGVKAQDALDLAASYGMTTIVTDHHTIEHEIDCDILIHPNYLEEQFSTLCGAGIAFECVRSLGTDNSYHLLLAAIASVGDVMPVIKQTRRIIQQGIQLLNEKREMHISPFIKDSKVNEVTLSFQVVPKINAVGRLCNMANVNNVVRYLLSEDPVEVSKLHKQIEEINDRRKKISDQMCNYAMNMVHPEDKVILIQSPGFHEGIIGLVAGKICATYDKPVIVGAQNVDGYKLSMRSPKGFHCMDFLGDFEEFSVIGGHEQAAGFSIDLEAFGRFVQYVKTKSANYSWKKQEESSILIDPSMICIEDIESLDALRPFGPAFKLPMFKMEHPKIKTYYDFQNHKHRRYTLDSGLTCMYFNQPLLNVKLSVNKIQAFEGQVQISEYQGRRQPNFMIEKINYE